MVVCLVLIASLQGGFTIQGVENWDGHGMSVFVLGDITGDLVPEVASSAFCTDYNGINSGSLSIYDGAARSLLRRHLGENTNARFGEAATNCGDVNQDGFADYITGARLADHGAANSGSAYIWSGLTGQLLARFDGPEANGNFGVSVSGAGDMNRDGFDDVLIGADWEQNKRGVVRVYSVQDNTMLYELTGKAPGFHLGMNVAGVGDVNADGTPDFSVSAPYANAKRGRVYILNGATGEVLYSWDGTSAGVQFGRFVAATGDTNGDGFDDIIVGVPCADEAILYSGQNGLEIRRFRGRGFATKEGIGHALAPAGDVDQDGYPDILIGAHGEWDFLEFIGPGRRVYIYSGLDGSRIRTLYGTSEDDAFGASVYGNGYDLNGDAVPDLVIGAPAYGAIGSHAPGALIVRYN